MNEKRIRITDLEGDLLYLHPSGPPNVGICNTTYGGSITPDASIANSLLHRLTIESIISMLIFFLTKTFVLPGSSIKSVSS
jgi:hypothetical protein